MWFSVGMSKVEEITSPLMERCMSVDLFGALVDEQAHEVHLGVVGR